MVNMQPKVVLIGAGGHAKVVMDCLGDSAYGFIDDGVVEFAGLRKLSDPDSFQAIISFGGVTPEGLARRQGVFEKYKEWGVNFVTAIHASGSISAETKIGAGCMVGPRVVVNSGAVVGENVIINSGAIVEHDVVVGDGAHIAPGAIVLGGAKIGKAAMIGAGAVVLPGAVVADGGFVKALSLFRADLEAK